MSTIANGKLSVFFYRMKNFTPTNFSYSPTYEGFEKCFETYKGKICSSFACDGNNFPFFEKSGASQIWIRGDEDDIHTEISKAWGKNMKITGCGAHNSSWIIIMTSGVRDSDIYKIRSSWDDCLTFANTQANEGYRMKGICYNLGLKQYFIHLRNTSKRTKTMWFDEGELKEARKWLREIKNQYQVDFIFKDPTSNQTYIQLEKADCPHLDLDLAFDFISCC